MKIEFHIKDVVLTAKQKAIIEKKLLKLKRYTNGDESIIDIYLRDESSPEKGGIDQTIELSTIFLGDKIFIERKDDRLMRGFANAYKAFEDEIVKRHKKKIDQNREAGPDRFGKLLKALKIKK
jgi:ribosome-associated translation inhibitor RaiA